MRYPWSEQYATSSHGGQIIDPLYPQFKPDYTPREIILQGAFGGTYYRPIHSSVTGKNYKDQQKEFRFFDDIDTKLLTMPYDQYDPNKNKYKVKVGTTLEFWESKGWIDKQDPYGWFQWYCRFYNGRRSHDDIRQIKRWEGVKNRFGKRKDKSNGIRQVLLEWGIAS